MRQRVHLLVRGPSLPAGGTFPQPATVVDLAPTFLEIAGVPKPASLDGKSLLPLLRGDADAARAWRTEVLLEYLYVADNDKCVAECNVSRAGDYPTDDEYCVDLEGRSGCWGPPLCTEECYPTESSANNWRAVRQVAPAVEAEWRRPSLAAVEEAAAAEEAAGQADFLYAEFVTGDQGDADLNFSKPDFYELYDMATDAWSMRNVYAATPKARLDRMRARLSLWYDCLGDTCP